MPADDHDDHEQLATELAGLPTRFDMWVTLVNRTEARRVAEIGVYRGEFAEHLLDGCPGIADYYMLDPWRHLEDWNKPANRADHAFEGFLAETLERTAAHESKRIILRGRTTEKIAEIPDGSLDVAYVDGDHTLRGITTDMLLVYDKVRPGGWIGGDDFHPSIHQHRARYEPTFVFPWVVYFAEAVGATIYALGRGQFLLQKPVAPGGVGAFRDLVGKYPDVTVAHQLTLESRVHGKPRGQAG